MTKTFKQTDNLFFIDGCYYGIDKDARIKENTKTRLEGFNGDWYYNSIYKSIGRIGDITDYDFKIIFSTNPSLELPLLVFPYKEDEIEDLILSTIESFYNNNESHPLRYGFIAGYKSNPAKFTEQDMIDFAEWIRTNYIGGGAPKLKAYSLEMPNGTISELLNLYLQSKEKLIDSFEVEMENKQKTINYHKDLWVDCWQPKLNSLNQVEALNIKYK